MKLPFDVCDDMLEKIGGAFKRELPTQAELDALPFVREGNEVFLRYDEVRIEYSIASAEDVKIAYYYKGRRIGESAVALATNPKPGDDVTLNITGMRGELPITIG